jgi:hypothetical protein
MSAHAYYNGLAWPVAPLSRKAFRGLSRVEQRVAAMESVMAQIAESARHTQTIVDEEPRAAKREFHRLKLSISRIAADAEALAEEIDSARGTLVQLDDIGMGDAADDDRTLEVLAERVEAVQRLAADVGDTIGNALDEIEEYA